MSLKWWGGAAGGQSIIEKVEKWKWGKTIHLESPPSLRYFLSKTMPQKSSVTSPVLPPTGAQTSKTLQPVEGLFSFKSLHLESMKNLERFLVFL